VYVQVHMDLIKVTFNDPSQLPSRFQHVDSDVMFSTPAFSFTAIVQSTHAVILSIRWRQWGYVNVFRLIA